MSQKTEQGNGNVYSVYSHEGRIVYLSTSEALARYLDTFSVGAECFIEVITEAEYRARVLLQLYTSHDIMVPGL